MSSAESGADDVLTTLADAVLQLTKLASPLAEPMTTVGLHPIAEVQPMAQSAASDKTKTK